MINIIGTYNCKADAKCRVSIPSGLKDQLIPLLDDGFVLKYGRFSRCLELYPKARYNEMMLGLREKDQFDPENVNALRKFVEGAQIVKIDGSNRLQIPKDLAVYAGIGKEVVLTATIDIIEVWDRVSYDEVNNMKPEQYSKMLKSAFGINDKPIS